MAYNVLSAAGWSLVLYRTLVHLFGASQSDSILAKASVAQPFVWVPSLLPASLAQLYTRACTTYDAVGQTTAYVQSAAALEVLHVLFGLVRSPIPTTLVQVSSRLFSVWCIAARFPSVRVVTPSLSKNSVPRLLILTSRTEGPAQPVLREHGSILGADGGRPLCVLRRDARRQWKRTGAPHLGALLDLLRALSDWRGLRGACQLRHAARIARARRRVVRRSPARAVGCVCPRAWSALHCVVARYVF